jgi:hypothetical protein
MDSQYKGSLYFNELINYYLAHSTDNQMMYDSMYLDQDYSADSLRLVAWTLKNSGLCTVFIVILKFLKLNSLKFSKKTLIQVNKNCGKTSGRHLTKEEGHAMLVR